MSTHQPPGGPEPPDGPETHGGLQPSGQPAPVPRSAESTRRAFLFKLSLVFNGIIGAVLAVPVLGYLLGPGLRRDEHLRSWVSLGALGNFPAGETRLVSFRNPTTAVGDGMTGNASCWVRHIERDQFQVFAINCAHLGCPVRWFPQSRLFMCPCHGGAYYQDGSRASGPPERGLFEYQYTVTNNNLMINAGLMPTLSNRACADRPAGPGAGLVRLGSDPDRRPS